MPPSKKDHEAPDSYAQFERLVNHKADLRGIPVRPVSLADASGFFEPFGGLKDKAFCLKADSFPAMPRFEIDWLIERMDVADQLKAREWYTTHYSWALICREAVSAVIRNSSGPVFEACAGNGSWAHALRMCGLKNPVDPVDTAPGGGGEYMMARLPRYMGEEVLLPRMGDAATEFAKDPDRDVLIVWPPYRKSVALDVAARMVPGRRLFYVGESEGGCCADSGFFERLGSHFAMFDTVRIPQFRGIHDCMEVYECTSA